MTFKDVLRELLSRRRSSTDTANQDGWEKSAVLAGKIVRPGPDVSRKKAEEVVSVLREQSEVAASLVAGLTKLEPAPEHRAKYGDRLAGVSVVDRANWALWAARGIGEMIGVTTSEPVDGEAEPSDLNSTVEATAVLTFLSQRTLGQFIPFTDDSVASRTTAAMRPGHLVLVAPNILATQRSMAVDLRDFSLWIAIHEHTHAMQFAAATWLPAYLREHTEALIRGFDSEASLVHWMRAIASSMRGQTSVIEFMLSAEQRDHLDRVTSLMSVLEGHADFIMDRVPRSVIETKRQLRRIMDSRRTNATKSSEMLGRVSGFEAKTQQYLVGAQFVRQVNAKVGIDRFNCVFDGPQFLPTIHELDNVQAWLTRTDALLASSQQPPAAHSSDAQPEVS